MTREEFEEKGLTFNREGEFAKKDASGRLRRVDEYGNIDTGRRNPDRPDDVPPQVWHKMRAEEKTQGQGSRGQKSGTTLWGSRLVLVLSRSCCKVRSIGNCGLVLDGTMLLRIPGGAFGLSGGGSARRLFRLRW